MASAEDAETWEPPEDHSETAVKCSQLCFQPAWKKWDPLEVEASEARVLKCFSEE